MDNNTQQYKTGNESVNSENKKQTILVVDDEQSVCNLISEDLSERGYLCCTALDAIMALDEMQKQHFDVVLLDIRLPVMSGLELLSRIRSEHPDTLVIMITGVCNADIMVEAFQLGALHCIIKPFDIDELAATVRLALETNSGSPEIKDHQSSVLAKQAYIRELINKASAFEDKNKYNAGHSQRVSAISVLIAEQLDLPQKDIEKMEIAALVHDIGMIGVNESIPAMKGKPSCSQFQRIAYHCEAGELILARIIKDNEILGWVRNHHERYDGGGYPDGLSADEIPMGARILAVAEAYDAMTSQRPYRSAMSAKAACDEIKRHRKSQFDPDAAEALLRIKDTAIHDAFQEELTDD